MDELLVVALILMPILVPLGRGCFVESASGTKCRKMLRSDLGRGISIILSVSYFLSAPFLMTANAKRGTPIFGVEVAGILLGSFLMGYAISAPRENPTRASLLVTVSASFFCLLLGVFLFIAISCGGKGDRI